jgi:hypothetical protein
MVKTQRDADIDALVAVTAERLKPRGYRRRKLAVRVFRGDIAGIIGFQRSTSSTRDVLKFSVNVGVICGPLLPQRVKLNDASVWDAHVRQRLGYLSERQTDHWWTVDDSTDIPDLGVQVSDEIARFAVPLLEQYLDRASLIALWESGRSPGLTDGMRRENLERLRAL